MMRGHRMGFNQKTISPHAILRRCMMVVGGLRTILLDACQSMPSRDGNGGLS